MNPSVRRFSTASLILLWGSALSLSGPGGCVEPDPGFDDAPPDDDDAVDDDDSDDDDDDDATDDDDAASPPSLEITAPSPAPAEVADLLTIPFVIDDPDSDSFFVEATWETDSSPPEIAFLAGSDNPWQGSSPGVPTEDFAGEVVWDTVVDIPTTADGVRVTLCPSDAEGNAGVCQQYPEEADDPLTVFNAPPPNPGAFCQPGDVEPLNFTSGEALIALSDGICLNYQAPQFPIGSPTDYSAQFLIVMLNAGDSDATYEITWDIDPDQLDLGGDDDDATGDDDDSANPSMEGPLRAGTQRLANRKWQGPTFPGPQPERPQARMAEQASRLGDDLPGVDLQASTCAPNLTMANVHADARPFKMRIGLSDTASDRETVGATLRALGDTVAIYVDNSTPLDLDFDCDGVIDEADIQPASGFDSCDLQEIVDIVDANIAPTLASLYGDLSDVDGDCRVTVLLSHRLNQLTSDLDLPYMVRSLAEPEIDLWGEDASLNPNSNAQEILYVYAPDPLGLFNPNVPVGLDGYLNFELAGQIASSWQKLISYGVHREVGKTLLVPSNPLHVAHPPREEDWLDDGMGWLAADMTGFGAVIYPDAWAYLDGTHLEGLQVDNTIQDFEDRGAQYLFARYLVDVFGSGVIWDVLHASTTNSAGDPLLTQGVDSVLLATGEADFAELALEWAAAMAVSGRLNGATPPTQLVADVDVRQYDSPTTVQVPDPTTPVLGEPYGANGFQQGIQLRGFNHTYLGGRAASGPSEVLFLPAPDGSLGQALHRMEGPDPQVFHPDREFYGSIVGHHGVATVLVSGLVQPENFLLIEASSEDLLAMVVRLNDYDPLPGPGEPGIPVAVEDSANTVITSAIALGELEPAGSEHRIIGNIGAPAAVALSPTVSVDLMDTDRYALSLLAPQRVGVWVDRRVSDPSGLASLPDPFIAVALASDVPDTADYTQWNFGPTPADGPCPDAALYQWPSTMPDWVHAQGDLIPEPRFVTGYVPLIAGDGDSLPGELSCLDDHDQDGISDLLEPLPTTLADQILQRQAENLGVDPTWYAGTLDDPPWSLDVSAPWFDASFIDVDSNEEPADDLPSAYRSYNVGGRALGEGEEAVWQGLLPAGDYTIIVGDGSGGTGPYDLSVRLLPN